MTFDMGHAPFVHTYINRPEKTRAAYGGRAKPGKGSRFRPKYFLSFQPQNTIMGIHSSMSHTISGTGRTYGCPEQTGF
jgi:hypothetical protein